jgi:hypothetical protein
MVPRLVLSLGYMAMAAVEYVFSLMVIVLMIAANLYIFGIFFSSAAREIGAEIRAWRGIPAGVLPGSV